MNKHLKYFVAFGAMPSIAYTDWEKFLGYFPDIASAWEGESSDFLSAGLTGKWVQDFNYHRSRVNPEKILTDLDKHSVTAITIFDKDYPVLLKEIHHPPHVIYIKGDLRKEDTNAIAIVGSRKGSDYGKKNTFKLARGLSGAGITVVSGLAIGLDTEAHKGALDGGGRTIAVLAGGLDKIYPPCNRVLSEKIILNGCLLSEKPLGADIGKQSFPARNRIISGLSHGVVIAEAGEHSGTLHTANFALEQNRQVYAIPGRVDNPLSVGPNEFLKKGAKPVTEVGDILEDFGLGSNNEGFGLE